MRCCWQICIQFHTVVIAITDYFVIFICEGGSVYHLISQSNKLPWSPKFDRKNGNEVLVRFFPPQYNQISHFVDHLEGGRQNILTTVQRVLFGSADISRAR